MVNKFYTLPKGTEINGELIKTLINSRSRSNLVDYYKKLEQYYMNEAVTSRERPHELLAITNHARYIVKTNIGYLLGRPVDYLVSDDINIDLLVDTYRRQTIANLDVELASDASIYGHAFERIYTNEETESESAKINPKNIILAYDDTVKHNKLFAVIYAPVYNKQGQALKDQFKVTILTDDKVMERNLNGANLSEDESNDTAHTYGEVPVIEYLNGADRMGDFEPVVPLIDAYNILQSDRILDRERLVDAILAFYGTNFTEDQRRELKESRIIANVPTDAKIEYIIKAIDEADADVLRKTIASDIHKISMTPDMSDDNFAGNSSGVALLYKLLAFEQHIKDKERYFEAGLINRFRVYNKFLNVLSNMEIIDGSDIDVVFKRALPQNDLETSQIINNLTGLVDKETLVSQLSFVRDAKETVELAKAESNQAEYDEEDIPDANKQFTAETEPKA